MNAARNLGWFVIVVMSVLMANILLNDGMDHGVGLDVFLRGSADPWQLFINNDLVTGLLFMCAWMILRGRGERTIETVAWIWMVLWWGNIVVAAYVIRAAWQARGDWPIFFMGRSAGAVREIAVTPMVRVVAALSAFVVAAWLANGIIEARGGAVPVTGYVLGFVPIILSLAIIARAPPRR